MNRPHCILLDVTPAEGGGFEPPVREPVRQFSKLLVSATHPSFQGLLALKTEGLSPQMRVQRYNLFFNPANFSAFFFRKKLFEGYHLCQILIQVEGILERVAVVYIPHSQIVKLSLGCL